MASTVSLRKALTIGLLLAAVFPLLILGFVAFRTISSSVREHIQDKNRLLCRSLAGEVQDYLIHASDILDYAGRIIGEQDILSNPSGFLQSVVRQFAFFESIQVIDATGTIVHIAPHNPSYVGNDATMSPYVKDAAKDRRLHWSETFISSQSGHPSITLSVRHRDLIIVGFLDLVKLNAVTDRISFGTSGQAAITDSNGTLIAHRDRRLVAERLNISDLTIVKSTLAGREGTHAYSFRGEAHIGTSAYIPMPGWAVMVFQTEKEAQAYVRRITVAIGIAFAGSIVLVAVIAIFGTRRFLRPIDRLVESARRIAKGDYPLNAHPESYREINQLSSSIDAMSQAIREREGALIKSEEEFRVLVENANELIFVAQDWEIRYANPRSREVTGYSSDEFVNVDLGRLIHPDDIEMVFDRHMRRQKGENPPATYHIRFVDKDKNVRWGLLNSVRIKWEERPATLNFLKDITLEKQLESQLRQSQKMEAVGRLAGGIAHDFNNMLGIIMGNAEIAIEDTDERDPIVSKIMEIQKAAERSADLTRQLLAFARKQTISPRVIDLNETIEGMLQMLRRLIGEDIDLAWRPKIGLRPIKVDPSQIDQILANLCVNARDAIKGVGKVTIETNNVIFDEDYCREHEGFKPGKYVMFAVSDNGCGMSKETMDNIFEPFFTTKDVGHGTGLGLSTVYGIIKQNNGFINVYSELDKGTTFKIYLQQDDSHIRKHKDLPETKTAIGGTETILLVEDEEAILSMTRMMLERLGYSVLTASGSMDAIRIGQSFSGDIHLLLTDVVMPEMSGKDLSKKLFGLYPGMKCLFMSGYTANVIAHHGVLDEGINFIQKPFSREQLVAKVREAIDGIRV